MRIALGALACAVLIKPMMALDASLGVMTALLLAFLLGMHHAREGLA